MGTDYPIGRRLQLHPATDRWMMGDRYGKITGVGRKVEGVTTYRVKLDVSGQTKTFHPDNVTFSY